MALHDMKASAKKYQIKYIKQLFTMPQNELHGTLKKIVSQPEAKERSEAAKLFLKALLNRTKDILEKLNQFSQEDHEGLRTAILNCRGKVDKQEEIICKCLLDLLVANHFVRFYEQGASQ